MKAIHLLNSKSNNVFQYVDQMHHEKQTLLALFSFTRLQWKTPLYPIKDFLNVSTSLVY